MTFQTGTINDVSGDLCEMNLQKCKTQATLSSRVADRRSTKNTCLFLLAGRKLASTIMEVKLRRAWTLASQTLNTGAFFVTGTRARLGVA